MQQLPNLEAAEDFIWLNARLIDRHLYSYLFRGGEAGPVLTALRAYQNPDGGFGNAIEPDLRTPTSQPTGVWEAFEYLDDIDRFDDPMVIEACDFLQTCTAPDGGTPFVLPTAMDHPRAPMWQTGEDPPGSIVQTGGIVAQLLKHGIDHPWVGPAAEFCWRRAESLEQTSPYEIRFLLPFLEHAPDRQRVEAAFEHIAPKIFEQNLVSLDPDEPGETHSPLDYAPRPDSIARRLFSDDVIDTHLDALAASQLDDGGWTFKWTAWNPATTAEWRARMTIRALKTLRAYGRIE